MLPFSSQIPHKTIKLFEAEKYQEIYNFIKSDENYFTYSYQLAGFLSFKSNKTICKLPKYGRVDHFHFMTECSQLPDKFYYLTESHFTPDIESDYPNYWVADIVSIGPNYSAIEVRRK